MRLPEPRDSLAQVQYGIVSAAQAQQAATSASASPRKQRAHGGASDSVHFGAELAEILSPGGLAFTPRSSTGM